MVLLGYAPTHLARPVEKCESPLLKSVHEIRANHAKFHSPHPLGRHYLCTFCREPSGSARGNVSA